MNVLHISETDSGNGGARAAFRLNEGLQINGCNSKMLVRCKKSEDKNIIQISSVLSKFAPKMSGIVSRISNWQNPPMFSEQWFPDSIASKIHKINPDVVNLHWICNGFMQIETLKRIKKPIVWTLHDMWPFTGGCHYSADCTKYKEKCYGCPLLKTNNRIDFAKWIFKRKKAAWKNLGITFVASSAWMAECIRESALFNKSRVEIIPCCLDTNVFTPVEKNSARQQLGLPLNKKLILFGAFDAMSDERKGYAKLAKALEILEKQKYINDFDLVVFGSSKQDVTYTYGFTTHFLGKLTIDSDLANAYSAADVMLVPSLQEAFGQTASESLSCGTPVVAFNATGLKDIVMHQRNGYLAEPFKPESLAEGILWILENDERYKTLQLHAREKAVQDYSLLSVSQKYLNLYKSLIS